MFLWKDQPRPIVALSPMADMTDSAFCCVSKEFGAKIVFREMVSSEALVRESEKTWDMAAFEECERPIIQQIFGKDPAVMAEAARRIEEKYHPDGIDLNMGCPVYKLVSDFNGACLMKDPVRATAIIRAVKSAITVPVSVKLRLGWSRPDEILEFIKIVEDAGADLITIHGRTRAQGYSGVSDWEMIGRARELVQIPVLANGDIHSPEAIADALRITGAAGVLIARGALGNPWIFRQAEEILAFGEVRTRPNLSDRIGVAWHHAQLHVAQYGPRGIVTFRKHLAWYLKGLENVKEMRVKAMQVTTLEELGNLFTTVTLLENL